MACANPIPLRAFDIEGGAYINYVPCGYCLNCRADKQQYIIDRAEYEYKKRLTASFVTFTYDDNWNIARCAVLNPCGGLEYDMSKTGDLTPRFTLRYDDLQNFIMNIRHYIKNHPEIQNIMCQPDFSYVYVGEYGDIFNRNHFHVLFFGLDFAYCKKLLFEQWKYGFIDVLPLLDGGIRYVTKYMDKQLTGDLAFLEYDCKGLARPKLRMSQGFGKGILTENITDIKDNFMTYKARHGVRRPISPYWKKLLTGCTLKRDTSKTLPAIKIRNNQRIEKMKLYNLKDFSTRSWLRFNSSQILKRERDLETRLRMNGTPVLEFDYRQKFFSSFKYDHDKIKDIPIDIARILSENYRDSLSLDL